MIFICNNQVKYIDQSVHACRFSLSYVIFKPGYEKMCRDYKYWFNTKMFFLVYQYLHALFIVFNFVWMSIN